MIYPNLTRTTGFDEHSIAIDPPLLSDYQAEYSATDRMGIEHLGYGHFKAADLKAAHAYAFGLLLKACPECAGYTRHTVIVEISRT